MGLVFLGLYWSSRQTELNLREAETPMEGVRTTPLISKGPWSLLKRTDASVWETDVPRLGHVSLLRKEAGHGTRLWISLPKYAEITQIQATAKFGQLPPVRIAIDKTNVKGVASLYLPWNYPLEYQKCTINLTQIKTDLSSKDIDKLPRTVRAWPKTPPQSKPFLCGPATVSVRAWHLASSFLNDSLDVEDKVSMPPRKGENWDLDLLSTDVPTYVQAKSFPAIAEWDTVNSFPILDGRFQSRHEVSFPLPDLQEAYQARGAIRRFETADEEVTFHNVLVRSLMKSQDGGETMVTDPIKPITATTATGVEVTLYPVPKESPYGARGDRRILLVNYLLSPTENYPLRLPKSPVLKGRNGKVRLTLTDELGNVLHRAGSFSKYFPDSSKLRPYGQWMIIAIETKDLYPGVLSTLKLRVRHRLDLETYPFSVSIPILPSVPADAIKPSLPISEP